MKASSKRKAEALPNPRSNKRSKNTENEGFMAVPFEIPEIFALIGSFLVQKPANLVNLSRVNSRTHQNMCLASVWQQLGFHAIISTKGIIEANLLSVTLQNLEYQRTLQKSLAIQRKLIVLQSDTSSAISAEVKNKIRAKFHCTSKNLPDYFYQECLLNSVLTDEHITAIAKMLDEEPEYVLVPVIFEAFRLVLSHSMAEIDKVARKNGDRPATRLVIKNYYDVRGYTSIFPCLQRPYATTSSISPLRKKFLESLFLVCYGSTEDVGDEVYLEEYSCFIKFINETKAVIIVAQYTDYQYYDFRIWDKAAFVHYWKIDLSTKKIEDYGAIHDLASDLDVPYRDYGSYDRIIHAMKHVFECDLQEVYEDDNMSLFLHDCCYGKLLRFCLRDDTWGKIKSDS